LRAIAVLIFGCAAVVALASGFAACGSNSGGACGRVALGEGMPAGCHAGRALLLCPADDGFACGCVTDEQSCPECPRFRGVGCFNACNGDQYAVECGAAPSADAGPVVVYDDPPPGCQLAARGSTTIAAYCCPCE
jgi:hypothetical protein